jgi:aryl-alcohol dehydrogenase-like predicted oxidoreductase
MMAAAFDGGINFFDNAEGYAGGRSEEIMGQALKRRQAAQKPSTLNSWG